MLLGLIGAASSTRAADLEIGRWGLEGPAEFIEIEATAEQDSSWWPDAEPGEPLYRYFAVDNPRHAPKAVPLMQDATQAYGIHTAAGGAETAEAFRTFLKDEYPFIAAGFRELSPVLYFDFRGAAAHEYILDAIEIEVIQYSEFRGGGFSVAWLVL